MLPLDTALHAPAFFSTFFPRFLAVHSTWKSVRKILILVMMPGPCPPNSQDRANRATTRRVKSTTDTASMARAWLLPLHSLHGRGRQGGGSRRAGRQGWVMAVGKGQEGWEEKGHTWDFCRSEIALQLQISPCPPTHLQVPLNL